VSKGNDPVGEDDGQPDSPESRHRFDENPFVNKTWPSNEGSLFRPTLCFAEFRYGFNNRNNANIFFDVMAGFPRCPNWRMLVHREAGKPPVDKGRTISFAIR
jgi:hypothetical protein